MSGLTSKKPPGALDRKKNEIRERLKTQMEEEIQRLAQKSSGEPLIGQHSCPAAAPAFGTAESLISEKAAKLSRLLDNKAGKRGALPGSSPSGMGFNPSAEAGASPANLPRRPPASDVLSSSSPGAALPGPPSPGRAGRPTPSPARAIANVQGIVQDAWRMAHEDLAELMQERGWERRKKKALQDMLREYEEARRREMDEEARANLARVSAGLWQDSAQTREKLVLDLQHATTLQVRRLQQEAEEAYMREVEALRAKAKDHAAAQVKQLRATHRAQREVILEARRKELQDQHKAVLEQTERRLAEQAREGLASFRRKLEASVQETSSQIEDAYELHMREEQGRRVQEEGERVQMLERETRAAEEERLRFLMSALEIRLKRAAEDATARVAAYVATTFPRSDGAERKAEGGLGELPCLPFSQDEDDDEQGEATVGPGDATRASGAAVDSEVVGWVSSLQAWLECGCERLSVAVGELARQRAQLKKQGRDAADSIKSR